MSNYYPKALVEGTVITSSEVDLYVVPSDASSAIVTEINIVSEDATGETVKVYFKPQGETAGLATLAYLGTVSNMLPAFNFRRTVLNPLTTISVVGTTGSISSIRISGAEEK